MVGFVVLALLLVQIFAVWCAWRAIAGARTPQGSVGWVVFLLSAPYLGVIAYLFLGHHRYKGYLIARKTSAAAIEGIRRQAEAHPPLVPPVIEPTPFEQIAHLPVVRGNWARPLIDGQQTFDAVFKAIDDAKDYVLVQFFIVHEDDLGKAFHDRLVAAAERGVTVRFMVDQVGSHALPESYRKSLRNAGIKVADPLRRARWGHRFQINYRNHRKTVVVDGRTGFTGGLNIGDEYMGRDPKFGAWRDTFMEMTGPVVSQLQLLFAEDWHVSEGETLATELFWSPPEDPEDMTALVIGTGPADDMETGGLFFFAAIVAAKERVWIASPYCVPDTDILTALKHAALAGRDVRLMVPEVIDHKMPWHAAFAYFDELRAAGVQIWRYDEGFMHQKVVLVDNDFAAIGTSNLDNRSFRLNFEAMVAVFDRRFAEQVEAFLLKDFENCFLMEKTLDQQRWPIRVGAPISRLFAPLL